MKVKQAEPEGFAEFWDGSLPTRPVVRSGDVSVSLLVRPIDLGPALHLHVGGGMKGIHD